MAHLTRDKTDSIYKTAIAVTLSHKESIDKIRGRKSKAGKLWEIIEYYLENKKLK